MWTLSVFVVMKGERSLLLMSLNVLAMVLLVQDAASGRGGTRTCSGLLEDALGHHEDHCTCRSRPANMIVNLYHYA